MMEEVFITHKVIYEIRIKLHGGHQDELHGFIDLGRRSEQATKGTCHTCNEL